MAEPKRFELEQLELPTLEVRAVEGSVAHYLNGQKLPVLKVPGWKLEQTEHGVLFTSCILVQVTTPQPESGE